jgi:Glycosyl hydrolase family 71.
MKHLMAALIRRELFHPAVHRQHLCRLLCLIGLCAGLAVALPKSLFAADVSLQRVLPFNFPRLSDLRSSPRKAFAHWHAWPVSVDNLDPSVDWYQVNELSPLGNDGRFYDVGGRMRQRPLPRPVRPEAGDVWKVRDMEDEVRRAAAIGLDGFTLSVCTLTDGSCWLDLLHMLEAANNADPGFKIIPSLDMASLTDAGYSVDAIAGAIAQVANAPALMRMSDGRMVLAATNAHYKPTTWWLALRQALATRGVPVQLMLVLVNYNNQVAEYAPVAELVGSWGPLTPVASSEDAGVRAVQMRLIGKTYVAGVRPQLHRPKSSTYAEARGSDAYVNAMTNAITGDADWLLILTWNDHTEGGEIRPSTGTQWSFYDLTAYYLTWFKTRQRPTISRDVLYYFHRLHWTTTPPDPTKQPVAFSVTASKEQLPVDEIQLLAFLRSSGTLRIVTNGGTVTTNAPAGMTALTAPLASGYPTFELIRSGVTRIRMTSAFNVRNRIDWQDLLYRGGSSTRDVVEMVANPPVVP